MTDGDSKGRLSGRIALVTGASRGIGHAIARRFAAEGAHVVATARTTGGLEELDDRVRAEGGALTLAPLDLRQGERIDVLGASLYERFGRLDILVGNAGLLGTLSPIHHADPAEWAEVFAVNVHANQRLIRSLDPLLRQSAAPRAIFVTSGAAVGARAFWSAYAASKAALEAMVRSYAAEVRKTPIRVNMVDPGAIATRMRASAFPGEDPETLRTPEDIAGAFVDLAAADCTRHGERVSLT